MNYELHMNSFIKPAISIRVSELERLLNEQIPETLYDSEAAAESLPVEVQATKMGAPKLAAEGNTIHYRIPIGIRVRKDIGVSVATADCEMMMGLKTEFLISSDWSLRTKTEIVQYGWIKKPTLKVGFVTVPVETILLNTVHSKKQLICDSIDEQIMQNVNLQQIIAPINDLPNPVEVPFVGKIWWSSTPVKTYLDPLYVKEQALEITPGLKSNLAVSIGEALPVEPLKISSPEFSQSLRSPSTLLLDAQIALKTLEKIANEQFAGKPLPIEQFSLTANNIEISSEDKKLIVKAALSGGFKGNATIKAQPFYDKSEKSILFKDVELDLEGKDIKSKGIALIATKTVLEQLNQHLKIPFKPLAKSINAQINQHEIQSGIFLKSYITDYQIENLDLTSQFLKGKIHLEAILSFKIEKILVPNSNKNTA